MPLGLLSALLLLPGCIATQWTPFSPSDPIIDLESWNATSDPIVDLDYAQYQGSWDATSNMTSFLGVRYAAPPIGLF
jgi:hypothetical protein